MVYQNDEVFCRFEKIKNMKKILILNGSYHKNGMISALIDSFIDGTKEFKTQVEIENIFLPELKFEYCRGCFNCVKNSAMPIGECSINDGIKDILQKMLEADILVLATPIYFYGPTAIMKKFIERNLAMCFYTNKFPKRRNQSKKDKIGVILLSSDAPWPFNVAAGYTRYPVKVLKTLCKLHACNRIKILKAGGMQGSNFLRSRYLKTARKLGRSIIK